jgi:hypothetical protein
LDFIFLRIVDYFLGPLRSLGLTSREDAIIQESIEQKYAPALRNSLVLTFIAAPGFLLSNAAETIAVLAVISSVTGIAWFTISLKEVKEKFSRFGLELTKNMLQAFFITVFLLTVVSVQSLFGSSVLIAQLRDNSVISVIAYSITLVVILYVVYKLTMATIQFDANDAMLAGSTDVAKQFFEHAQSSLNRTAALLRNKHDLHGANLMIALAFNEYSASLQSMGIAVPDSLHRNAAELIEKIDADQETVDRIALQLFADILMEYHAIVPSYPKLHAQFSFAQSALMRLSKIYDSGGHPSQGLADNTFAIGFETIAVLLSELGDHLVTESKQL